MIEKKSRKALLEHDWLYIEKNDSNPSAKLHRWTDQANDAITDLTLFAEKLPDETKQKIFNHVNIDKLLKAMLKISSEDSSYENARKTELASLLVRRGAGFCNQQYSQKIEPNSVLNRPIIHQLEESIDICDQIASKMKLPERKSTEEKEGLTYLFNCTKIKDVHESRVFEVNEEDTRQFITFIDQERGYAPIDIVHKITTNPGYSSPSYTLLEFEFTDLGGYRFKGYMKINQFEKAAHLFVKELSVQEDTLQRDLFIRVENDYAIAYKKIEKVNKHENKS